MSTVQSFLLMTWERLPRKKQYKDWVSYVYLADAEHGSALTSPVWKVTKIKLDASQDMDEMRETDGYNNLATDLATVQALTFR